MALLLIMKVVHVCGKVMLLGELLSTLLTNPQEHARDTGLAEEVWNQDENQIENIGRPVIILVLLEVKFGEHIEQVDEKEDFEKDGHIIGHYLFLSVGNRIIIFLRFSSLIRCGWFNFRL